MPPPMISVSTLSSRLSMTPILSVTLAPPRMATKGRSGLVMALPRIVESPSPSGSRRPPDGRNLATPSVEAWARWAVPKASLT